MVDNFYELTLELIFKGVFSPPTPVNEGKVVDGDLNPFRVRLELVNTGSKKTDHGVLTLVIPPDGTFVRKQPLLVDESAKDNYIIQAQIKQHDGAGGENVGKAFRFTVANPVIQDDPDRGEVLKVQLIPMEYRLKEVLDAKQLKFLSPSDAFQKRLFDYGNIKGSLGTIVSTVNPFTGFNTINLPVADTLRQNWEPLSPRPTHEHLYEIIDVLSNPVTQGGTFKDYYFDCEAHTTVEGNLRTGSTNQVVVTAEAVGTNDTGVVIDPLTFDIAETEKDKTINIDLQNWKNNIIVECAPDAGTLPMEKARFASNFTKSELRNDWESGITYYEEDDISGNPQSLVKLDIPFSTPNGKSTIRRYFKCISTHTSSAGNRPDTDSTKWFEDFTVIPPWSEYGEYNFGDVVSFESGGNVKFYFPKRQPILPNANDPPSTPADWQDSLIDSFPASSRNAFISYTPWTSNYNLQLSNICARDSAHRPQIKDWNAGTTYNINDEVKHLGNWYRSSFPLNTGNDPTDIVGHLAWGGDGAFVPLKLLLHPYPLPLPIPTYLGVVPDWNIERALFDRIDSTDQFENVTFKAVRRRETNPSNISSSEKINGQRFLIQGTGTGAFSGHNNCIAEWFQPPESTSGEWKFSKQSSDFSSEESCLDLEQGQILRWNGSSWEGIWTASNDNNGQTATAFHAVAPEDGTDTSFGLVAGATGIPAQAIRLKFGFDPIFESRINLSSRGAWWYQPFPMPFETIGSDTIGSVFSKGTLDTTNLDTNRFGVSGWNQGLDSEDLGRIVALKMKLRLGVFNSTGQRINQLANMPFKIWAIDIFGRVWYSNATVKRNGEYSTVEVAFGDRAPKKLYHSRHDELFSFYGFTFSQNFFLKEKEFTGIEFDWRFVKGIGLFWDLGYDDNGMYIGARDAWIEIIKSGLAQVANYLLRAVTFQGIPPEELVPDRAFLDIDELHFKKTLYVNSDDSPVVDARSELRNFAQERDYLNAKIKAQSLKARTKFVNQTWNMQAQGDVRMRFGYSFKASGSRVPEQEDNYLDWSGVTNYAVGSKVKLGGFVWQSIKANNLNHNPLTASTWWTNLNELICSEVKHIIDSDGYTMQILGTRKFVYG